MRLRLSSRLNSLVKNPLSRLYSNLQISQELYWMKKKMNLKRKKADQVDLLNRMN
jgi:hypothetical protein